MALKTAEDSVKITKAKALPGWKKWCDYVKSQSVENSSPFFNAKLNRANARFAMASGFRGLNLEGFTEKSRLGYESVLRLLLTYTAAEALAEALDGKVTQWKIHDKKLASQLRPIFYAPLPALDESYDPKVVRLKPLIFGLKESTRKHLEKFMLSETDNVLIAATVLRHLMAHGTLTLNGIDLKTLRGIHAINSLSDILLTKCEIEFKLWLEKDGIDRSD